MFKRIFLLSALLVQACAGTTEMPHIKNYAMMFKTWMNTHSFNFTAGEYLQRLENFIVNDKFIDETNQQKLSYTVGHNQFSHMTSDEFGSSMLCSGIKNQKSYLRGDNVIHSYTSADVAGLPSSVDWRTKNVTSPIQNQKSCGSCYSFSSVSSIESAYAIKYGELVKLSEQEVVDCSKFSDGCNGGSIDGTFRWVKNNGGLCTEADYPYVSGTTQTAGKCQTCKNYPKTTVVSWTDVPENDKNAFMTAVAKQPISIAIEADTRSYQLYSSGIYSDTKCGTNLDHAVVISGYNNEVGQEYYILRNSWGSDGWGEQGYMRISMASEIDGGICGLYMAPSYPNF